MTGPSPSIWWAVVAGWFWISGLAGLAMAALVGGVWMLDATGLVRLPRGETGVLLIAAGLFPLTVGIGWAVRAWQLPRWRLWAYPRVDSVAELKRHARRIRLTPREGSWLERMEPASREQKARLRALDPGAS